MQCCLWYQYLVFSRYAKYQPRYDTLVRLLCLIRISWFLKQNGWICWRLAEIGINPFMYVTDIYSSLVQIHFKFKIRKAVAFYTRAVVVLFLNMWWSCSAISSRTPLSLICISVEFCMDSLSFEFIALGLEISMFSRFHGTGIWDKHRKSQAQVAPF